MKKTILSILFLFILIQLSFNFQESSEWWTFQGNKERTGYSESFFNPPLKEIWKIEAKGIFTTPIFYEDKMFVGCGDRHLYAFNISTGELLWVRDTDGAVLACPTVRSGKVFYNDINGKMYVLNLETGEYIYHWYHYNKSVNFSKPILVLEDTLYMIDDYGTLVIDNFEKNNHLVFYFFGPGNISAPSSDGEKVYLTFKDELWIIDPNPDYENRILYYYKKIFIQNLISSPVIYNDNVFLLTKVGHIIAYDKKNYKYKWTYIFDDEFMNSPAVGNDKIIVAGESGKVACLDMNGNVLWHKNLGSGFSVSPVLTNNYVFVASNSGRIYMLDISNGDLLWYTDVGKGVSREMSIYKNILFVVDNNYVLHAYSSQNPPKLSISTYNLDFGEVEKGEDKTLSFIIRNIGEGILNGTIESDNNWIYISNKNFQGNNVEINVKILTDNLSYGQEYFGKIYIKSNGGDSEIDVRVKIKDLSPKLYINPNNLDFGEIKIGESKSLPIIIKNLGGGNLSVKISTEEDWIKISKSEFESNLTTIIITIDAKDLTEIKEYISYIKIESNGGNQNVEVKFKLTPSSPKLYIDKTLIDFGDINLNEKKEVEVQIKNIGGDVLEGYIKSKTYWLDTNYKEFKSNNLNLKILIDTKNLNIGQEYIGEIEISTNGGKSTIYVKIKVTNPNIEINKVVMILTVGSNIMLINNKQVLIDVPPLIIEGRTYLPIRWIIEPLGARIYWDGDEKKVTINFKAITIELWIGKNIAKVNGNYKLIDPDNPKVVPLIINGRTMLPVRFVAENLGCKVDWDPFYQSITITYPNI